VLQEFCRIGTGDRPGGVDWVHGDYDGSRSAGPPV